MTDFCSSYYVSNFFLIVEGVIGALILVGSFLLGSIFCIYAFLKNSKTAYKAAVILFSITVFALTSKAIFYNITLYFSNIIVPKISLKNIITFLMILALPSFGIVNCMRKICDISFVKLFSYLLLLMVLSVLTNVVIMKWELSKKAQYLENCQLEINNSRN